MPKAEALLKFPLQLQLLALAASRYSYIPAPALSCPNPRRYALGRTLRESIYPEWKDHYIDYDKLKGLLREDAAEEDGSPWTDEDDNRFSDEILNVQLTRRPSSSGTSSASCATASTAYSRS